MRKFQERLAVMEATANAKSTFLANMSHEIRTPAAQVIQAVHMLSETDLNSIQREHVQVIIRSSELLLAILNDVLDLSKLENGKIRFENRTFDLHEALRQSVDAYTNPRKPVDVGCVMDRALPQFVVGDVVRLRQIFNNLLSNAVKFTNVGHVLLRAMLVSMDSTSARVRFSVQDTGCGIPQDRLASIFERFEQSDETITRLYGGTGLGLSICQSLCTLMNSSLEVTSELNRGSDFSFEVSLPFAPPDHIVPPHIHSPPPPILDPTAPPRLIRLVICTGPAAERPPQLPPAALRGTSSRVVATNSGSSNVLSGKSRPHDVMNDLLANYGIVVATVYTTCNALMDSANATGTGPKPNIVVITCPKRWPPIPPAPPRLPTVIVSGCDMLASADGGPTLVPPHSPYSNLAYVARPFKQTHLYRVLDTVAGLGDALPLSTLINGHSGGDSALVAEPPPIPRSPNAGSVVGGADTKADVDPQFNRLPSPTCACDGSAATGAPHNAPSVIASDLSSTAHTAAGSGLVAGGYAPLRVLVVDDNPLNRKLMQAMVAKLGHEVELAENGKVAVDRVLAMPAASIGDPEADGPRVEANEDDTGVANVDCIFMDVRMPVLDGLEATRLIVAHFDSLPDPAQRAKRPVIFGLSADALQESEETGLFHGMDVYLRKPLLRKDIETALNQYFGPNGLRHKKQP
ncbi:hypothetical protein BCR44DRAFT_66032 [Catenaria anguillulae PL171]|uniref:histidine kinase n=1 Tax=Catenaria anguillulae PL171 TaxID=765915 RepID=A0A1Y2H7B5_9FUNG|nr:hypothetical protein BCR44DRAFT_66032 [Catenaria anguillulae PL171]